MINLTGFKDELIKEALMLPAPKASWFNRARGAIGRGFHSKPMQGVGKWGKRGAIGAGVGGAVVGGGLLWGGMTMEPGLANSSGITEPSAVGPVAGGRYY